MSHARICSCTKHINMRYTSLAECVARMLVSFKLQMTQNMVKAASKIQSVSSVSPVGINLTHTSMRQNFFLHVSNLARGETKEWWLIMNKNQFKISVQNSRKCWWDFPSNMLNKSGKRMFLKCQGLFVSIQILPTCHFTCRKKFLGVHIMDEVYTHWRNTAYVTGLYWPLNGDLSQI